MACAVVCFLMLALSSSAQALSLNDFNDYMEAQGPKAWDIQGDNWIPAKGALQVCVFDNKVRVVFVFSEENREFFRQKFGDKRKPLGLEVTVFDHDKIFNGGKSAVLPSVTNVPTGIVYEENTAGDDHETYTLAILDPSQMNPGVYYADFYFSGAPRDVNKGNFELQFQLVGDMRKLRNEFPDRYKLYQDSYWEWVLAKWLDVYSAPGSVFFAVKKGDVRLYNSFSMMLPALNSLVWAGLSESDKSWRYVVCGMGLNEDAYFGNNNNQGTSSYNPPDPEDNSTPTWYNDGVYVAPKDPADSTKAKPDFTVREAFINHHHKLIRPGKEELIMTRLKNIGKERSPSSISVKYWRSDGLKIDEKEKRRDLGTDTIQAQNLPPGDSKWEQKHFTAPSTEGKYNISVEMDEEEKIAEVNEDNNLSDPYVFEVKKPELYFSSASVTGGATTYFPGDIFELKTFTENDGAEPGPDAKIGYYLDGVLIGEDNMRDYNLEPEDPPKDESIYVVVPQALGQHTVSAVIDPGNKIDERDDHNNTWQFTFQVVAPPPPTPPAPPTPPPAPVNNEPVGWVDKFDCFSIGGWVTDADTPNPINIHVYVADADGNNKTFVEGIVADQWRQDLGGNHGFSWNIPKQFRDGKEKIFYFYAINSPVDGSVNPLLAGGEFPYQCNLGPNEYKHVSPAVLMLFMLDSMED